MGKESGLRQALLFVALFLGYFLFSFSYFLYCLQRLLKGIGRTHLNHPRPPVLTPMSGSRGVVTLLAHISPACSTQPSISNVPPAQADNNFGHYKYPASTQPPGVPNIKMAKDKRYSDGLDGSILKDLSAGSCLARKSGHFWRRKAVH